MTGFSLGLRSLWTVLVYPLGISSRCVHIFCIYIIRVNLLSCMIQHMYVEAEQE